MAYLTILNTAYVRLSGREPAMYYGENRQYNISVPYGCNVELYNNNNEEVNVDIYIYQDGGIRDDSFAVTNSVIAAKSYAYLDYSRPLAMYLGKIGTSSSYIVIDVDVYKIESQTTTSGNVTVFAANYDLTHTLSDNIMPDTITLLRAATASFGMLNRCSQGVRFGIVRVNDTPISVNLGVFNNYSYQNAANKVAMLSVRRDNAEQQSRIVLVDECDGYAQLQWMSRRDGFLKTCAFKILSESSGGGDTLTVSRNLAPVYMTKKIKRLQLIIPSASYAQWYFIEDINYSDDIRMYMRRGSGPAVYDPVAAVRIVSAIPQHSLTGSEDITFEIEVEREVTQW